jgi:hemolysin III
MNSNYESLESPRDVGSGVSSRRFRTLSKDGSRHVTDEFYNTLTSSIGALLSVVGVVLLVLNSINAQKFWHVLSFLVYGFCLVLLFVSSALHHGLDKSEKVNRVLRDFDYYCIFSMIAGTFTPFCLILLRNAFGWSILGLVWFLAIMGIVLQLKCSRLPRWLSATLYIGIGWLGVLIALPVYQRIGNGAWMIIIGGFFYTLGAVMYYLERPNPFPGKFGFHEIWHLFVLAGAGSHFFVMYFYLLAQ